MRKEYESVATTNSDMKDLLGRWDALAFLIAHGDSVPDDEQRLKAFEDKMASLYKEEQQEKTR